MGKKRKTISISGFKIIVKGVICASIFTAVILNVRGKKRHAKDTQKPYYENQHKPYGPYEKYVKRPLDCFLASAALVVLSPTFLIDS